MNSGDAQNQNCPNIYGLHCSAPDFMKRGNSQGEAEYEAVLPDDVSPTQLQSRVVSWLTVLAVH